MSQIILAIRHAPLTERLFRWQAAVIVAFAGGSRTAALFNIGALMAFSIARSALSHVAITRRRAEHHA